MKFLAAVLLVVPAALALSAEDAYKNHLRELHQGRSSPRSARHHRYSRPEGALRDFSGNRNNFCQGKGNHHNATTSAVHSTSSAVQSHTSTLIPATTSTSVAVVHVVSTSSTPKAEPTTTSTHAAATTSKTSAAPPATTSSTSSTGSTGTGNEATQADVDQYLSVHNTLRAAHGASAMTWNTTLAAAAQTWANKCVFQHSGGSLGPYGENLAAGTGTVTIANGLAMWSNEESSYNPSSPEASHYTQMVWKGSHQLGCALATCAGGTIFAASYGTSDFYVCEYYPPRTSLKQAQDRPSHTLISFNALRVNFLTFRLLRVAIFRNTALDVHTRRVSFSSQAFALVTPFRFGASFMASGGHKKILPNPNQTPPPQPASPTVPTSGSGRGQTGAPGRPVLRVNQACNACRKLKMRCDGPDSGSCSRCRTNNIPCVFEKVPKAQAASEQRLEALESQFSVMQSNMVEILSILRRNDSGGSDPPSASRATEPQKPSIGYPHRSDHSSSSSGGSSSTRPQLQTWDRASTGSIPTTSTLPSNSSVARQVSLLASQAQISSPFLSGRGDSSEKGQFSFGLAGAASNTQSPPSIPGGPFSTSSSNRNSGPSSAHHPPSDQSRFHYDYMTNRPSVGPLTSSLRTSPTDSVRPIRDLPSHHASQSFAAPFPPSSQRTTAPSPSTSSTVGSTGESSSKNSHTLPTAEYFARRDHPRNSNFDASAVTSAANSDDEGDIPTEAMVRPIHVLDTLANESQMELDGEDEQMSRSQISASPSASSNTTAPTIRPPKRKRPSFDFGHSHPSSGESPDAARPAPRRTWTGDHERSRSRGRRRKAEPKERGIRSGTAEVGASPLQGGNTPQQDAPIPPNAEASGAIEVEEDVAGSVSDNEEDDDNDLDVVARGLIPEEEARSLYALYFSGCYRVLACFNPATDTYESMRGRSAFCFCAILLVASKVEDAGNPKSATQLLLERECVQMARNTIYPFGGVDDDHVGILQVESVQAMLILAGWSHSTSGSGWLMAGHAIRCAVQLGVHKALPRLERRIARLAQNPSSPGPEAERVDEELFRKARTWCALYVIEAQTSFGTGRPTMMKDKSVLNARHVLLDHPQSIETDWRVTSTCELLALQGSVNDALGPLDGPVDEETIEIVNDGIRKFDDWLDEWDRKMGSSTSAESRKHAVGDFWRSSAAIQHSYAQLFTRSMALRYIKTTSDAQHISPEMKDLALSAIANARDCIGICVHNQSYRDGMRFAVAYTHTCAAFAAAFLLRFARLMPRDMDILETISLVEELVLVLGEVPASRFARALTTMLSHTRARLATEPVRRTPSDSALRSFNDDGVNRGRHTQYIPPVLPIGFNDITMQPQQLGDDLRANVEGPASEPSEPDPEAVLTLQQALASANDPAITDGSNVTFDDLQNLLGHGAWAPWFQNSMFGDIEQSQAGQSTSTDFGAPSATGTDSNHTFSWGLS
ncbi:hypothetical protein DL93DRAFT_2096531 [Clavulina sp. PMI_390]|nr:hypothetical protein DL93DRAFT_2096531 [Clavulina sp. PMI_390]